MRTAFFTVMGVVGMLALSGCSDGLDGETLGSESDALTGISTGLRHDFNGDGKEDVILVNTSGSYEYLGAAPSGFVADAWVRNDLTSGSTKYTAGDFNGDGKTDLIITTPSGSFEYTGKAGGGFNANVWSNSTLVWEQVDFTVGDFNGDGKSDLIVTTASGSSLYTGKGTGGFNANVWSSSTLKRGGVLFTPRNYNGDSTTDLLVTTTTKTSEYTGKTGTGGFNVDVWTSATFVFGGSAFTTGDYNADGKGDFIVQTDTNANLYYGQAGSGFTGGFSIGIENNRTAGPITAGDFNGDLLWDVLLPEGDLGTIEHLGQASGAFTAGLWGDSRYHFYDTVFHRGDFNGDGRDDFIALTRPDRADGLMLGTREATGKSGSAGGFNSDVWIRNDIYWDTLVY